MLHRVVISGGRARYTNRFVRTPMVVAEEQAGHAIWPGLATPWRPGADEVGPVLAGTMRQLPDVNVVRHGGRLLALAECDQPYRMGPQVQTLGQESFGGALPAGICAHPKIDPRTGEMVAFCDNFAPPFLTWTVISPDGTGTVLRPVEGVERPSMIHDMAITERYVVLVVAPLFFDITEAMKGGSLLQWKEQAGTRVALIPRDGGPVRWCEDEAFWLWHTANAHDAKDPVDGSDIVVLDCSEWARPYPIAPGAPVAPRRLGRHRLARHPHRHRDPVDADRSGAGRAGLRPDPYSLAPERGWWLTLSTRLGDGQSNLLVIPATGPRRRPGRHRAHAGPGAGRSIVSIPYAVCGLLLVELFPAKLRYSGVALSFNLAGVVSGFMPLVASALLVTSDGASWPAALLVIVLAVITVAATLPAVRLGARRGAEAVEEQSW